MPRSTTIKTGCVFPNRVYTPDRRPSHAPVSTSTLVPTARHAAGNPHQMLIRLKAIPKALSYLDTPRSLIPNVQLIAASARIRAVYRTRSYPPDSAERFCDSHSSDIDIPTLPPVADHSLIWLRCPSAGRSPPCNRDSNAGVLPSST